MNAKPTLAVVIAAGAWLASPARAQSLYPRPVGLSGVEGRGYAFRAGLGLRSFGQWSIPLVVAVPFTDRFSADVSTRWASTNLKGLIGSSETVSGMTDTQLRLAYTFGRDLLVVSAVANLPTGKKVDQSRIGVVGAASGDFLTMPVSQYGSGTSFTGGAALARRVGAVNFGLGASARKTSGYEPFDGVPLTYNPGLETRVQLAADATVGSGRIGGGLTLSTFASDNFTTPGGAGASQAFQSGNRLIAELSYSALLGAGMLSVYGWDFHRSAGKLASTAVVGSRQNIFDVGASWRVSTSRHVRITPLAEIKQWSRDSKLSGRLASFQLQLEIAAGPRFSIQPFGRTDWGFVTDAAQQHVTVQGWGTGLIGRLEF
ncbi:MAG: hypothetical protein HY700_13750 [Gemmatimonadetes bacterium]|nr:hypothetical protein [Gemmatimonadota bacterium]